MSARAVTMLLGGETWREVCDSSTHRTRSCVRHWQSIRQTKYTTPRWPSSSADSLSDSSIHIIEDTYPLLVVVVKQTLFILHILHIPCAYLYFIPIIYFIYYNLYFIFCAIFSIVYICIFTFCTIYILYSVLSFLLCISVFYILLLFVCYIILYV